MAIFVVLATVAGIVIVAITTSGNEDLEASGSTDLGENCRPHEVRDQALESMGISGTHEHLDQYKSETIGCKPYCGTWEYYSKGQNANGVYEYDPDASLGATIGGPDGAGGVYSSNTGCFAPCYLQLDSSRFGGRHDDAKYTIRNSILSYIDDNRLPVQYQIRLGVNYRRRADMAGFDITRDTQMNKGTDIEWKEQNAMDRKPYINTKDGAGQGPAQSEMTMTQRELGVPTIFIPNFMTRTSTPDPGGTARNSNINWVDENWEYRADPINRTCTIVNVTLDDQLVCSSEEPKCNRL